MPDFRTNGHTAEFNLQHFLFLQRVIAFVGVFDI